MKTASGDIDSTGYCHWRIFRSSKGLRLSGISAFETNQMT